MSIIRKTGEFIVDSLTVNGAEQAAQEARDEAQNSANKCAEHLVNGNYGKAAWELLKGTANEYAAQKHQSTADEIRSKYQ
jgi:acyl-CoA-binding protein